MSTEPNKPANPHAFPFPTEQTMMGYNGTKEGEMGMTLLDHFAGEAMAALIAALPEGLCAQEIDQFFAVIPRQAYTIAAVMLAEREKHL